LLVCLSVSHTQGFADDKTDDSDCTEWFKSTGIDSNSPSCEMDCSMTDADMSNFACVAQCDSLCKPKPDCRHPKPGGCDFYRSCVEDKFQCGPDGYALGYGEKYCQRFRALEAEDLSSKGLAWRDYTLNCLEQGLADLLFSSSNVNTCSDLKTFAFKSHVACYTSKDHSVCDLSVSDWAEIISTVDFKDALSDEGRTQVRDVIRLCKSMIVGEREQILGVLNSPFEISETSDGNSHDKAIRRLRELDEKLNFINSLR